MSGSALAACSCLLVLFGLPLGALAEDVSIAEFEGTGFPGWEVEGEAFGTAPARGTLPSQMEVSGFEGRGYASSYHGGDDATGVLRSPAFRVERRYLNFLIGGGGHAGETCINLVAADGRVLRSATGPNTRPGGSEALAWETWDLSELRDRELRLEVVDRRKGGWGHVTVDAIRLGDVPAVVDVERTWTVDERYLIWPVVRDESKRHRFLFRTGDEWLSYANIALSAEPDFWVFTDLAGHQGETLTVSGRIPGGLASAWESVELSPGYPGEEEVYEEARRPRYHFTSRRGWLNDPNGLVHHDGTWHLCYQHNPYNIFWDNMTWGHATSSDLFHWKEGPPALVPDRQGVMYSGSGFVVPRQRTRLPIEGESRIVVAYTAWGELSPEPGHLATQGIAYSPDGGRSFTKFGGNPVVDHLVGGNRDPKIFWHEPTERWVMALYHDRDEYGIHVSPDLVSWEQASTYRIPGDSECPDLFPLAVDGDPGRSKWLAWGANGVYLLGDFDGRSFTPTGGPQRHYWGNVYAGQSYDNAPDGRRVHIGWMRGDIAAFEGAPFSLQMSLPMDFSLRTVDGKVRLWIEPSPEVEGIREESSDLGGFDFEAGDEDPLAGVDGEAFELEAEVDLGGTGARRFGFRVFGEEFVWDRESSTFTGAEGVQVAPDGKVRLRIFSDIGSVECFVNGTYVARYVDSKGKPLAIEAEGGDVRFDVLKVHRLGSVWE